MYDLSILIPARNEQFLKNTVEDLLKNIRGKTEIIVVLDGAWSSPALSSDERLTVVYHPVSVGQRAATNEAARLSKAKYLMKVDAHCAFDEGFDVKMIEDMQDNWTMVPVMKNLHAFDWKCANCGRRTYQGGKPLVCESCGSSDINQKLVWQPKKSPNSTSYRFDKALHFQYFGEYKKKQDGDLVETMSLQGSCFMMTREKYWELDICDEKHGSWGQQGVEVACKTWLSGGRVIVNRRTWYAHLFRTQPGFGFPYPLKGSEQEKAREYSRDLWLNNRWDKAIHPLSWLIDKFAPVPGWHDDKSKGIIYYTDNKVSESISSIVQKQLKATGLPIVSCSLSPIAFGENYVLQKDRGYITMFEQIYIALCKSKADIIFFCEHDILYQESHFEFIPPKKDVFYYNTNVWKTDGVKAVRTDDCKQVSGLVAYRELLVGHYKKRLELIQQNGFSRAMGFEPGTHGRPERVDDYKCDSWESRFPNIDIRHDKNLTETRWSPEEYRNEKYTKGWKEIALKDVPGWQNLDQLFI